MSNATLRGIAEYSRGEMPRMMRSLLAVALVATAQAFAPGAPAALRAVKPAALAATRSPALGRVVAPIARQRAARPLSALNMVVSLPAGVPLKVGVAGGQLLSQFPVVFVAVIPTSVAPALLADLHARCFN